jgi:hypothetical protein
VPAKKRKTTDKHREGEGEKETVSRLKNTRVLILLIN